MAALSSSSSGLLNRNAAALTAGIPCKYGTRAPQQEIQQSLRRLCSQILRQNRSATHLRRLFIFNAAADGSAAATTSTTSTTTTTTSSTGSGTNIPATESASEDATPSTTDVNTEEETEKPDEFYEVEITKPYGLKFFKGADGGTYIDAIAPEGSAATTSMEEGDKVLATSAVFGDEIWPAAEYGRTMYTIRQRIGPLIMKMQKKYGVKEGRAGPKEELSRLRNATTITERVREMQTQNYLRKKELAKQRKEYLIEGLKLYKKGAYEDALGKFESILGMSPDPDERSVVCYNLACCYSQLNQIDAGFEALEEALEAGFDNYKHVRTDKDIGNLRASEERFKKVIDKYDEPILSDTAIAAINTIKNLFGFGKK